MKTLFTHLHAVGVRAAWLLPVWLAGCTAGPDFRPPVPPADAGWVLPTTAQTASAATDLGQPQQWKDRMDLAAPWWRHLGSPQLDALIDEALSASPTLAAAQATLRQAQELQSAQTAALQLPRADLAVGSQRQQTSPSAQGQAGLGRAFSLHSASVGVQYPLDLAGGNRRALEGLAARTEHRRYQLEAARLGLAASVATAAIAQSRLAAQAEALQALVDNQEQQEALARERVRLGHAMPDELLALHAQREQARSGLPLLHKQRQQAGHLLAMLAGRAPGAAPLPAFTLGDFRLPEALPLVVPSELVRQRPDIQAAQALMQAASADYGVAVARLYPQIRLSANLGSQALSTGALFGGGSAVWALVGQLTQSLFNPALPAERRAALAALDAAAANYQAVVLEALRGVADALRAVEGDADALAALARADAAAQGSLQSMERQHALGSASYLQLLVAQQQALQVRSNLVAAQAQRLADSALLFQAVGAGWEGAASVAALEGR
ncbi:MAG: efflux transporter outer membrane subunit [Giesbergeria sp.]|jgi:NodT family efflux transporter outer membrane factor (OMF) lipoprotein|nr:efflux transporter outer membrane subunit [Giesbergeria sp.]